MNRRGLLTTRSVWSHLIGKMFVLITAPKSGLVNTRGGAVKRRSDVNSNQQKDTRCWTVHHPKRALACETGARRTCLTFGHGQSGHPHSPDLYILDNGIWGTIQIKACAAPHRNAASLKASVEKEWLKIQRNTWRPFRPRLEANSAVNGGHCGKKRV